MSNDRNDLIEMLPVAQRARLKSLCSPVHLVLGETLFERGDRIRHVHFPVDGFVSLVANVEDHPGLEVGMIGREGMLGMHVVLAVAEAPFQAVVQGAGLAWRVEVSPFRRLIARSPGLQRVLLRYTAVLMSQLASSAACLRFHEVEPRLARWLLMSQDRAHDSHFSVTQEFLAFMLGVRRVGITTAASVLQRRGLIAYHRGAMTVVDRAGLELAACSCYRSDRQTYERVLD